MFTNQLGLRIYGVELKLVIWKKHIPAKIRTNFD